MDQTNGKNGKLSLPQMEQWLWDAACAIRGGTDAPKFKDFILPLVFYKRLSDVRTIKKHLQNILQFNELGVVNNAGKVRHEDAVRKALGEFDNRTDRRRALEADTPTNDFDKLVDKSKDLRGTE